jgi:hypothetical protein
MSGVGLAGTEVKPAMYTRHPFYVEGPYDGKGRESIPCQTEQEVEQALQLRPGWRVWEMLPGRGNMRRRPDLERGGNCR